MANKKITIGLDFDVNLTELNKLKAELNTIIATSKNPGKSIQLTEELKQAGIAAEQLEHILNDAWNPKLGQLDLSKFNKSVKEVYGNLSNLKKIFESEQQLGVSAFNNLSKAILNTNTQMKKTNKLLDSMATSMANTVKWGITSSIFNNITGSIQKAWDYSLKLDNSLNDIRIITGKSADEMERFAKVANASAKDLRASTLDYTQAALIYYQQGLGEEEVQARANTTLKVANVTGQSGQAVSEQLTAVWNGYKVAAEESELYIDKLSAVAATTAADLEELSTGMSKVASAANAMGVDVDQLNAQLATIISVTRQAPESVGTALKTIYARMGDIEAGITDDGVTLGDYTEKMAEMGVHVLNVKGELRDMGEVIEEVGNNWNNFSREQQIALAQTMAGTRQYNNLIALFDSWEMYEDALDSSKNSAGELQKQQDIYMESTEAYLQKLATEAEETYDILFDDSAIKTMTSSLTGLLNIFNSLLSGVGGGLNAFAFLGTGATNIFSSQIGQSIAQFKYNRKINELQKTDVASKQEWVQILGEDAYSEEVQEQAKAYEEILRSFAKLSKEEQEYVKNIIKANVELKQQQQLLMKVNEIADKYNIPTAEFTSKKDLTAFEIEEGITPVKKIENQQDIATKLAAVFEEVQTGTIIKNNPALESYFWSLEALESNKRTKEYLEKNKHTKGKYKEEYNLIASIYQENISDFAGREKQWDKVFDDFVKNQNIDMKKASEKTKQVFQELKESLIKYSDSFGYEGVRIAIDNAIAKLKQDAVLIEQDKKDLIASAVQLKNTPNETFEQYEENIVAAEAANTDTLKALADKVIDEEELTNQIKGFSTLSNTLIGVGGIIKSVANDTFSLGQAFTVLTAILPPLIMNSKHIGEAFEVTGQQLSILFGGWLDKLSKKENIKVMEPLSTGLKDVTKSLVGTEIAVGGLTITLGTLITIVGATVAAVGILGYAWYKAEMATKEAAETAKKQIQNLKTNFEELNQKAEELKENISEYNNAIESLEKLDKTTQDYKDTLKETNDKARILIETLGLFDKYTIDEKTGLIKINPDVLAEEEAKAERKRNNAQTSMYYGQLVANETQATLDFENFVDKLPYEYAYVLRQDPKSGREIYNRKVGVFDNREQEFSKIIEALLQKRDSGVEGAQEFQDILASDTEFENFLTEFYQFDEELIHAVPTLKNYREEFQTYIKQLENASEDEYYIEQINLQAIEDNYGEELEKLATDKNGKINNALYEVLKNTVNASASQQQIQRDRLADVEAGAFSNPAQWSDRWSWKYGLGHNAAERQFSRLLSEYYDTSATELFGQEIENKEDLAKIYATQIKGIQNPDSLTWEGNQLKNGDQVIVDVSSREGQAEAWSALWNLAVSQIVSEASQNDYKKNTEEFIESLSVITENAGPEGNQYGVDFRQGLLKALSDPENKFDFSYLFDELSPDEIEEIKNKTPEEILTMLGLTKEEAENAGIIIGKSFYEGFDGQDIQLFLDNLKEKLDGITGIINSLQEGKALSEEQTVLLSGLENEYKELSFIRDKNSKEYIELLKDVNNELEEQKIKYEQMQVAELIKTIDIEGNPEKVQETLEEIADEEYEVLVAIKADVQSDFDNIVNKMTGIEEAASKIGDNFIVSASDLEEINDVFPGILANMNLLEDGSAQLSEESVQDAIKAAQGRLAINTEETIKELESEREKLLVKQQAAQDLANIAGRLHNNQKTLSEEEGNINKALNELKEGNAENTANYEEETQKDVVDASVENSNAMADNFSGAYKKMAADSKAWADAAKSNMLVARLGIGKTTAGVFSENYLADSYGVTVNNAEKGSLEDGTKLEEITDWEAVQKHYQDLADSYGRAINNITGKIAEARGRQNAFNTITSNIGLGLGEDGKATEEEVTEILEMLEDEVDIYHDINIEIQKVETSLKRLQNQQEKTYGIDLINNLNEQLKLLNKQTENYQNKMKIATVEAATLRALLDEKGVIFNEDGSIDNYEEAFLNQKKIVDDLRAEYNKLATVEEQEAFQKRLDEAQEVFDFFKENIEKYEEIVLDTVPELEDKIQENLDEIIENNVQKFNMEIELRIETSEAERDWNEFKKKVIDDIDDDDILGNAKASLQDFHSYYKDGYEGVIQVNTDHVNDILFELREMDRGIESKYYGNNRQKALEDLKTYYAQLTEDLTAIDELSEEVRQSYLDMMDEAQAEFDKQIASYEQITNLIDHDLKLLELLGGEKNYKSFSHYYDAQVENNKKQLDFQRQQVEFWKEEMDNADEGSERWLKAKENLESTTIAWRELTNKSIEDVQAKYLNAIKLIFEELNNEITSGKGLEYIKEEWDLITKNSEKYLDNINAAYGIEQLRNKYQEAIDNTDSISAQEQLNDLMAKEIAALEEKDKLTEYDVERANKRYEIALKQIALEEAQQNKTSMKLKRDSQGNYSYVFTADEDAVSKAEDELADAQNALYNFDKENYLNNLDELYAAYEEYQEKMLEAAQINDPEERAQKELLINEQYGELINGLTEQNQNIRNNLYESAFEELARLQDKNAESFKNMTQTQKDALMNDLIPQWESGIQQMADKFAGEGGLEEVCKGAMEQISEATQQYKTDLEEVEETSGLAFDKIEQGTDTAIQETQDLIIENEDLIETYEDELEAIQDVITELDTLIEKFAEAEQAAKDAAEAAYYYTRNEDYDSADAAFGDRDYSLEMTRAIVSGEDLEGEHYTSSVRRREKKIGGMEVKVDNKRLDDLFAAYIAGDEKARFVVMEVYNGRANYTDEFLNKYGFNTGGYTGNWSGDEGRLALLHQKELVLNANDTQNILNAVQIIRSVEGSLLRRMSEMTSNIGNVYSIAENKETLKQNVHIEANFPNVTNSKEVENAIDNLINIAAQRTHRDIK